MNDDEQKIEQGAEEQPDEEKQLDKQKKSDGDKSTRGEQQDVATAKQAQQLYDDLGIKAKAPTGKSKGRPKTSDVRAKNDTQEDGKNTESGRKKEANNSKSKSKNASDSGKNEPTGDEADEKGKKVSTDAGKVSDESEDPGEGVRKTEPKSKEDSQPGGEGDSDRGDGGTREEPDESKTKAGENEENEEGKRPGKSDPKIERRFQKLTNDVRDRDQRIAELEKQLEERQKQYYEEKANLEDPEYTVDDFRRVRDEEGNVLELDENQAELAYRRWKDGYEQRKAEREARFNYELERQQKESETVERLMKSSAEAYDSLSNILNDYPELDTNSKEFDQEFSDEVMPLIQDLIIYQPGTEPGNEQGLQGVIVGMRSDPQKILKVLRKMRDKKRSLPLNGINDNVEDRSNVQVPHGRSSDPDVNAANELYKELGIKKTIKG